jgi:arsenite transporter
VRGAPAASSQRARMNRLVRTSSTLLSFIRVVSQESYSRLSFSFWGVARSVLVFLGAPLLAGVATRYSLIALKGREWLVLDRTFLPWFAPVALLALVYTVLVLFALQGQRIVDRIGDVARVAIPLLLYFVCMWTCTVIIAHRATSTYEQAITQAFTAAATTLNWRLQLQSAHLVLTQMRHLLQQ